MATGYRTYQLFPVGRVIRFTANLGNSSPQDPTGVLVKIVKAQEPCTYSCGLVVEVLPNSARDLGLETGTLAFLKLFDRRFACSIRQRYKVNPWTLDIEDKLLDKLESGGLDEFVHRLQNDDDFEEDKDDPWDAAENEAYLGQELLDLFKAEVATYSALQEHQGELIPRLFAQVSIQVAQAETPFTEQQRDVCLVRGVLLEYLPGFTLSSLPESSPQSSWQSIVDQATRVTHILGANNIINDDLRPDNMMVVPKDDGGYKVFMIDFGQCRIRKEGESNHDWRLEKWAQDEEGAIGLVMKMILSRAGFQLHYERLWNDLECAPWEDGQSADILAEME